MRAFLARKRRQQMRRNSEKLPTGWIVVTTSPIRSWGVQQDRSIERCRRPYGKSPQRSNHEATLEAHRRTVVWRCMDRCHRMVVSDVSRERSHAVAGDLVHHRAPEYLVGGWLHQALMEGAMRGCRKYGSSARGPTYSNWSKAEHFINTRTPTLHADRPQNT